MIGDELFVVIRLFVYCEVEDVCYGLVGVRVLNIVGVVVLVQSVGIIRE